MKFEFILDQLLRHGPAMIEERGYRTNMGRCIISTRVASKVLKRFGFDPRVVPVIARASNAEAVAALKQGEALPEEERAQFYKDAAERGAKVVEIDPTVVRENSWPGHLVVVCERMLIDLDVVQFRRPTLRVDRAVALPLGHGFWSGNVQRYGSAHGVELEYVRMSNARDHRISKDWYIKKRWLPIVDNVETLIKKAVTRRNDIESLLREVHSTHYQPGEEFNNHLSFEEMVRKFAGSDFYKLHSEAKEFLNNG